MDNSFLQLKNCRQHNLKNISLDIPKYKIVAITGVSGSGKSSLAFDTLFAEGQRRYLEYLSPESRLLIKQMPKPDVDIIEGLSPTLAIGQERQILYARGTVATYTDIYDFLALLYAKCGEQHSPSTGKKLTRYSRQEIIDLLLKEYPHGTKLQLIAPVKIVRETVQEAIKKLQQMGFARLKTNGIELLENDSIESLNADIQEIEVVVDRLEMKEDIRERLSSSVETAMDLSRGILKIQEGRDGKLRYLTEIYVCPESSISFAPLVPSDFNFNSPKGACPYCKGVGGKEEVDSSLIFTDSKTAVIEQLHHLLDLLPKSLSSTFQVVLNAFLEKVDISEEMTVEDLSTPLLEQLLFGSPVELKLEIPLDQEMTQIQSHWKGLAPILDQAIKDKRIKTKVENIDFIKWQPCPVCKGARLKPESLFCLIHGKGIQDLCAMPISEALKEIKGWNFSGKQAAISQEIIPQIESRLTFLEEAGLGYLELNREGNTLSNGETQRVQLSSQIGAKLSGIIYILDEPSLGLHRQDIQSLYKIIQNLKNLGNSVIYVEHEKSLISQAEQIIELGPGAGIHGGQLIFQGSFNELLNDQNSPTGLWLSGQRTLPKRPKRKIRQNKLHIHNASLHNLKNFSLDIPLGCLVGFCGVSGSGKSTLVQDIIGKEIESSLRFQIPSNIVTGQENIKRLMVGHNQHTRSSSRSIPATYVDLMTPIRNLFAETKLAKARGYTASRFSLNKKGGRCGACEGLGQMRISMQFMPDIYVQCDVCQGLRYNYETLQVTWENRNIAEVLGLSVEEAAKAFRYIPALSTKLDLMNELGLDYLTLGQAFNTLSAGEIQRLKLVSDLSSTHSEPTLYILDEPSAGLHFEDIEKLVRILHRLVDKGHTIFVVEHHLDILKQADWVVELGPGGGPLGGKLLFEGTPEKLATRDTPTGRLL